MNMMRTDTQLHARSQLFSVDPVFSSHMVMQQKKNVVFFGTADGGEKIRVEFADQTAETVSGDDGKWRVEFPPMAGGSRIYQALFISSGASILLEDILIGEVWFCSGQSNMQMPVSRHPRRHWSADHCEAEVQAADYPEIRFAFQKMVLSHNQRMPAAYEGNSGWVRCSPETVASFSAVAYFFGRELYQQLQVPVGLICAAWGGSRIEPWISEEGFLKYGCREEWNYLQQFKLGREDKKRFEETAEREFRKRMTEWHKAFAAAGKASEERCRAFAGENYDDSSWHDAVVDNSDLYVVRWFRCHFAIPENIGGRPVVLSMGRIAEECTLYLNGVQIGGYPADAAECRKQIRVEIMPSQWKKEGENVLAVRGEYFYNWEPNRSVYMRTLLDGTVLLDGDEVIPLTGNWKSEDEARYTAEDIGIPLIPYITIPYSHFWFPANMYNGMVDAWTSYQIRGVIWFQGCSNHGEMRYDLQHRALIADWRQKWSCPDLPFILVQLAGFEPERGPDAWLTASASETSGYALTRDIQLHLLDIPGVGIATAFDLGEADNPHPGNKQDVGRRLSWEAARMVYGLDRPSRGPLFKEAVQEHGCLRVRFYHAEDGLMTSDGKAPGAFAVAGETGRDYFWAEARIDGDEILVSSPYVPFPVYVRYGYANFRGDCNLFSRSGLPAYPFRSDGCPYAEAETLHSAGGEDHEQ